jgi:hypothetical protein
MRKIRLRALSLVTNALSAESFCLYLEKVRLLETCPLCNSKLEKGFLVTTGNLWWDTKKHGIAVGARASGAKQLTAYSIFLQNLESYHCSKCKLVLFKY